MAGRLETILVAAITLEDGDNAFDTALLAMITPFVAETVLSLFGDGEFLSPSLLAEDRYCSMFSFRRPAITRSRRTRIFPPFCVTLAPGNIVPYWSGVDRDARRSQGHVHNQLRSCANANPNDH